MKNGMGGLEDGYSLSLSLASIIRANGGERIMSYPE